ncbi:PilN domain-containing protein [candidate division KSB1 bacterium]|nr:PilN domain-containing protein [candidate division KSB1 bacterium]
MVKQFTINLNKGEGEVILKQRKQERRSYLVLGLLTLVFVVLGGMTWAQTAAMRDVVQSRQQKLERIRFELDSLKREGTKVSKDDVSSLAKLENDRFLWARRLEKLAEILPAGMAVTGLDYQNKVFRIQAVAQVDSNIKEFEVISKFIELLKGTPEFRHGLHEIRFDQSLRKVVEDQDALIFSIECLTADPDAKKKAAVNRDTKTGINF